MNQQSERVLDINAHHSTHYCVDLHTRDAQIKSALARGLPMLEPSEELKNEPIAIVCYGPSLRDTFDEVKEFKHIITCSGAHKFLHERGICPVKGETWYHAEVDPREHKVELMGEPHFGVDYLIASTCHPNLFDHLLSLGCSVKLWHVFDGTEAGVRTHPRGGWALTGGCSVGLRAMALARFMGYTDLHVFGMDGNEGESGKHAGPHPSQSKEHALVQVNGRTFKTTPSLLEAAKQTFHELDQLPDVTATFYGDGLVQEMAKTWVPKNRGKQADIAIHRPELISDNLREMNAQLHRENPHFGNGGHKYAETVQAIVKGFGDANPTVLDYGCGKGTLQEALPFAIFQYDPAIRGKDELPRSADLVVCTDVLEHVEPDKLPFVLDDLKRCVRQIGFFVIHLGPAMKSYPDGRNAHLIQEPLEWWEMKLTQFFDLRKIVAGQTEMRVIAIPKDTGEAAPEIVTVKNAGTKAKFLTTNKVTKWRAESILTKEKCTVDWINWIPQGSVLYDIGANIGGYTILAGCRGIEVYAFEPEAENYALLCQNIDLNTINATAYCLAVGEAPAFDKLYLGQKGAGGSCHSFGKEVGFDLTERKAAAIQGSFAVSLDYIASRLPKPDFIKIDVDGFEHQVIAGGLETLKGVKGLIIEVNPALGEHHVMLKKLKDLGFTYNAEQVEKARRQSGPFAGVAEYIFTRSEIGDEVEDHILVAIENTEVVNEPFPHFIVQNVLPRHVINKLVLDKGHYAPIAEVRPVKGYPERFVCISPTDEQAYISEVFQRGRIQIALLRKFGVDWAGKGSRLVDETLWIKDFPGYSIGPHTDSPAKVLSALLYLNDVDAFEEVSNGTTLYRPKDDPSFTCEGGPHHPVEYFRPVKHSSYRKNRMLVFLKTDRSFHGVEKVTIERDVFLYDIRSE